MGVCVLPLRAIWLVPFSLSLTTLLALEQGPTGTTSTDGQLRSQLSLGGRTVSLVYSPNLTAPGSNARTRIGQLDTTGSLRLGSIEIPGPARGQTAPESNAPPPVNVEGIAATRYDLWLEDAGDSWQLSVIGADGATVGQTTLARRPAGGSSRELLAALLPHDTQNGHFELEWNGSRAVADLHFANPARRRATENREPNTTVNRTHDADTSVLSRGRLLAQRNETAIVFPSGPRLSVTFQRTIPPSERRERDDDNRPGLGVDGPDFARLLATPDRQVVMFTEAPVPHFKTTANLQFGSAVIPTGNQTAGFPGTYGIWLKRVGTEWRLVFNNEPDVWGSQHDGEEDVAEVNLSHSDGHDASRPFAVALEPTSGNRGRLHFIWGPHQWTAEFALAR